jgi:signal transduction histidine kinase
MRDSIPSISLPLDTGAAEAEQRFLTYQRDCLSSAQAEFLLIAPRELRSPLTLIQGYSAMLAEMSKTGALSSEQAEATVRRIASSTLRLSEIVEDVLDIAAIRADALDLLIRPISPTELVNLVAKGLRQALAACQQTLSIEIPEELPQFEGDITRLRQAFQNIIGSVIEPATPGDGITLSSRLPENSASRPKYLCFRICISGANLNAKDLTALLGEPRAMEEILGEKEGKKRAGLKIAIAKGIIEAHGGRLWAEITEPDGARRSELLFHIELPLKAVRCRSPIG